MKTQTKPTLDQLPQHRKSAYSILSSLTALAAGLALFGGQSNALAQADNFNDGNDTAPTIAWTQFDGISTIFGAGAQCAWNFPGGNTYQLTAVAQAVPPTTGPARVSSFAPTIYTNFYQSVEVVAVNNTVGYSVFGMLARAGDFATAGVPSTRGYGFCYVPQSVAGGRNFIAIFRLRNDASTSGVPGSSGGTAEVDVTLDPAKKYRMVFIGQGTHLEGRVYELPNLVTPIAVVSANTAGEATQHTDGQSGLLAFNLADNPVSGLYLGGVDVTFDNFYASARCPMDISDMVVKDNFNDGNDTAPTIAWQHYDPIFTAFPPVGPQNTWTFPGGNTYKLTAGVSPDAGQLGQGRVASTAPGSQSDFRISADIVKWDDAIDQNIGLMARLSNIGPGSTEGYVFTYDVGGNGDMDVSKITGEVPTGLTLAGSDQMKMIPGNSYRFVFSGKGSELRALVFELPETMNPLVDCVATDATYASGVPGLIGSAAGALDTSDVTFDNYSDTAYVAPAVSVTVGSTPGGNVTVTWPYMRDCIWVLESSPAMGAGAVWTNVPLKDIVYTAGNNTYTGATPMAETGNTYYRLKQL